MDIRSEQNPTIGLTQGICYSPNIIFISDHMPFEKLEIPDSQVSIIKAKQTYKDAIDKLTAEVEKLKVKAEESQDKELSRLLLSYELYLEFEIDPESFNNAIDADYEKKDAVNVAKVFHQWVCDNHLKLLISNGQKGDKALAEKTQDIFTTFCKQILSELGVKEKNWIEELKATNANCILVGRNIPDNILFYMENIVGIVTENKGTESETNKANDHASMIARGAGIPILAVSPEDEIFSLGSNPIEGLIINTVSNKPHSVLNPTQNQIADLLKSQQTRTLSQLNEFKIFESPDITPNGKPFQLFVNIPDFITNINDNILQFRRGAGLVRTELLFDEEGPTVETQHQKYLQIFEQYKGKPITWRVFDTNPNDKALKYLHGSGRTFAEIWSKKENVEVYETQIEAILRAAIQAGCKEVKIMAPMVETPNDIILFQSIVGTIQKMLGSEFDINKIPDVKIGAMIETPKAVINIPRIYKTVDFASIGTNDLFEGALRENRFNNDSNKLEKSSSFNPAKLLIIAYLLSESRTQGFASKNKLVGICGDVAGESIWPILLANYGASMSVTPEKLIGIKTLLSKTDTSAYSSFFKTVLTENRLVAAFFKMLVPDWEKLESIHKKIEALLNAYEKFDVTDPKKLKRYDLMKEKAIHSIEEYISELQGN